MTPERLKKALETFEVMAYADDEDGNPTKAAVVVWGPSIDDVMAVWEAAWLHLDGKSLEDLEDFDDEDA